MENHEGFAKVDGTCCCHNERQGADDDWRGEQVGTAATLMLQVDESGKKDRADKQHGEKKIENNLYFFKMRNAACGRRKGREGQFSPGKRTAPVNQGVIIFTNHFRRSAGLRGQFLKVYVIERTRINGYAQADRDKEYQKENADGKVDQSGKN